MLWAMMISAPEKRPDAPTPATARPMINMDDDIATPHIKLPNSKVMRKVRYEYFGEKL
jgi:hypothetical protein